MDEYAIGMALKQSDTAVIMGVSAGAMNMCAKWIASKFINPGSRRYTTGETKVYDGLGLDGFALEAHFEPGNDALVQNDLLPLSQKLDVYAACYESAICLKDGKMDFFGEVYLVSGSRMRRVDTSI